MKIEIGRNLRDLLEVGGANEKFYEVLEVLKNTLAENKIRIMWDEKQNKGNIDILVTKAGLLPTSKQAEIYKIYREVIKPELKKQSKEGYISVSFTPNELKTLSSFLELLAHD